MFNTIIISIVAFLIIVLLLVGVLLYAKKKLMPSGIVKLTINGGEKTLEVEPGNSLLSTLSEKDIFL
ncbi:MAG: NADH:ubiquinone reductase (Na(+)-transporting) subunit F, partial [Rikenellaceae bacterium]